MKGEILTIKHLWGVVATAAILMAVSCAKGFDGNEKYSSDVRNKTLTSPDASGFTYTFVTGADQVERLQVKWPIVFGAGGYECRVTNVNDNLIVADTIVDGLSIQFEYADDVRYEFSVLALGNDELNNKTAESATLAYYTTGGESVPVSANQDLGAFIASYLANNAAELAKKRADDPNFEVAFDLEAGGKYTYETPVDMGPQAIRLRNLDEANHTTITMKTPIETSAGVRAKNINFDCTDSGISTLIALSDEPDESVGIEALGYKAAGADRSECWYIEKPIILEGCWVKNLPNALIYCQKRAWAVRDLRVLNSIIQLKNTGSSSFIRMDDGNPNNTIIKDMTLSNSTIYNTEENSSAYFIRYANASNARPDRMYGSADNTSTHRIENCTIVRMFTNKDFANNMLNNSVFTQYVTNCVFFDVFRIYQYLQTSNKRYTTGNTMWYDKTSAQDNDTGGRTDSNGNGYTTKEDPGFGTSAVKELDFSQPNGGLNFHATGAISSQGGDPRWR